jgi:hypothetical protein
MVNDYALQVCIAEGATHGAHGVADSDVTWVCIAQVHRVAELRGWCGRVTKSNGTVDGICAARGIHVLPSPPHAVNLRVVEVEPIHISMLTITT